MAINNVLTHAQENRFAAAFMSPPPRLTQTFLRGSTVTQASGSWANQGTTSIPRELLSREDADHDKVAIVMQHIDDTKKLVDRLDETERRIKETQEVIEGNRRLIERSREILSNVASAAALRGLG
ncbi:hypothetical protein EN816_16415 [Mesorhizobium sp. M8A.F.Ca.ET.173.01.1.1]|uniref:hypothetical protein n=1 Tax=Mesorhizobium sp. M8A.F.Ca.ET.207.01.1.1 TaxID=2563968 RepID=UPI001091CD65|nr:hypothetical protein [Mesorhizobium sp. M8A.F.Ca.ET.207.01.1.1]TGQ80525.1 hypothetical protein EN850_14885 [Mesorhizobium sp. M8A.F.Ca.ET.207.01.1.1]TGV13475.1 hypothetical protein EN816_16415 [Mesorhizobium sp. M8A.F.Ca.ET.173.01.1.1]